MGRPAIKLNLRGNMGFYPDECGPYITAIKRDHPLALEAYSRLRDSFRDV